MKKDLVKELYVAPEWGMRVVVMQRCILSLSTTGNPDIDGDNVNDDGDGWSNGN